MSERTSLGRFLLEKSVNKQGLTQDEMMAEKLHPTAEAQMIWDKAAKQFFTCGRNRKTLGKVFYISLKVAYIQLGN